MPDDSKRGLFFPAEQAAAVAAAPGSAVPDPTAEAAAAELARPGRRGLSRRLALRWAGWGTLLLMLGQWSLGFLGFFRPGKTGAFGGTISAGAVGDLKPGEVKAFTEGKFYLVRVAEGFVALWWKCPHLGCTVPWKESEPALRGDEAYNTGEFHCPCHGSQYNRYGQILFGPAPRPMDAFPVTIEGDKIKVETGPSKAMIRPDNAQAGPDAKAIARA